jgi:K+-transporting ATPase ATPase A chain
VDFGILQIAVFVAVIVLITKPLGAYMARVFRGERTFLYPVVRPVERLVYRLCGVDESREMGVWGYLVSLLVFDFVVLLLIYVVLRLQGPCSPS